MNYQYFVQIVPTDIQTLIGNWPTFQYSVKEQAREVGNYGMGSGGIPGNIFELKYSNVIDLLCILYLTHHYTKLY